MNRKTGTAVWAAGCIVSVLVCIGTSTNSHKATADETYGAFHGPVTLIVTNANSATMVFSNGTAFPIHWEYPEEPGSHVARDGLKREWYIEFQPWYYDVGGMLNGLSFLVAPFCGIMALYYLTGPSWGRQSYVIKD